GEDRRIREDDEADPPPALAPGEPGHGPRGRCARGAGAPPLRGARGASRHPPRPPRAHDERAALPPPGPGGALRSRPPGGLRDRCLAGDPPARMRSYRPERWTA